MHAGVKLVRKLNYVLWVLNETGDKHQSNKVPANNFDTVLGTVFELEITRRF